MKYFSSRNKSIQTTFFLFFYLISSFAMAQATFVIWPIYPKIESDEKAVAVWLENTGKTDAMVQIRVFKWNQNNYKNDYSEQNEIIPSPPVAKVKAGEKHMLRLTKASMVPSGEERAYRVIVDELPVNLNSENKEKSSNVNFQMRYSIPLFVYGKGLGSGLNEATQKINAKSNNSKPILTWAVEKNSEGKSDLILKNQGKKFARLTAIRITENAKDISLGESSFGYILPNASMKFEIHKNLEKNLNSSSVIYGVDTSGVKQELIKINKEVVK
ncbi:Sigma-fimbriae chaperone protein [Acinetobacter sp. neg1]|uniref:fimbrial biogenesis chaperone n=1 Tax=Acinetobacter sp. neg1 TaxID=1561068 RepID=UPI000543E804|nr:molecular chaperone [Acinetobacter sp. neg1]KHF78798.1 Sigma-fimbriae chaperone protein [Acinetobacter sp. neg1]